MTPEIEMIVKQLSRMETKVDSLGETLVKQARLEEQLITLFKTQERMQTEILMLSKSLVEMERITHGRNGFFKWAERIGVIGLTFALTAYGKYIVGS